MQPQKMPKERASKYRGVYRCGKKWKAQIQIEGVQHYLGVFETEEKAAEYYQTFAMKHGRGSIVMDIVDHNNTNSSSYDIISSGGNNTTMQQQQQSHFSSTNTYAMNNNSNNAAIKQYSSNNDNSNGDSYFLRGGISNAGDEALPQTSSSNKSSHDKLYSLELRIALGKVVHAESSLCLALHENLRSERETMEVLLARQEMLVRMKALAECHQSLLGYILSLDSIPSFTNR